MSTEPTTAQLADDPAPLTDEQVAQFAELIDMHRQYGPALSIEGEAQLLVEVLRLRARVGVLEGQLATARALHKPERRYVTPDDDESSYDDPEWIAEAWVMPVDQVNYFTVCSHCGSIELGTGGRDYRESLWPCEDAKALGLDGGGSDAE